MKLALYPKDSIRARSSPGSVGSHSFGQKYFMSRLYDHVLRLVPPNPCTNMISMAADPSGGL